MYLFFIISTLIPFQNVDSTLNSVKTLYSPTTIFSYERAQDSLYKVLFMKNDSVECQYSGFKVWLDPNADPSTSVYQNGAGISLEHSFPQSKGAVGNGKSDLHHLFPVKQTVNASRGNSPYGEIPDNLTDTWFRKGVSQSTIPTSNINEWSERDDGSDRFEPRESIKGDVARAVFYFYTFYQFQADTSDPNFFNSMKETLYQWHVNDPPDADEIWRDQKIATWQGNRNPFIVDTSLVRRIYFSGGISETSKPVLYISEYVEGSSSNKYIEIFNSSLNSVDLSGYKLVLFSNGSATASTSSSLTGIIASGSTAVFKNSASTVYLGNSTSAAAVNFNGDDAIALIEILSGDTLDIIGKIGEDPGAEWVSGSFSTLNKTLVRKNTVQHGVKHNPSNGFQTLATEWDVYPMDDVSHLGSHSYDYSLPVELLNFNVFDINGNLELRWMTLSETNNSGFEIRASTGDFVWKKIGFVPGNGTTTNQSSYSFRVPNNAAIQNFQLFQIDLDGHSKLIGTASTDVRPKEFFVGQAYPNPFNPSTTIPYFLPSAGYVKIEIYNIQGQLVAKLLDTFQNGGSYSITTGGLSLSSGQYLVRIAFDKYSFTRVITQIK